MPWGSCAHLPPISASTNRAKYPGQATEIGGRWPGRRDSGTRQHLWSRPKSSTIGVISPKGRCSRQALARVSRWPVSRWPGSRAESCWAVLRGRESRGRNRAGPCRTRESHGRESCRAVSRGRESRWQGSRWRKRPFATVMSVRPEGEGVGWWSRPWASTIRREVSGRRGNPGRRLPLIRSAA